MPQAPRQPSRHVVCAADALPPGSQKLVQLGHRSIGVFNVDGRLYAVRNICPHRGAPLCLGRVRGEMVASAPQQYVYEPGRPVLRCPWHGYEFRLEDGRVTYDPADMRAQVYPTAVEDGQVVVFV